MELQIISVDEYKRRKEEMKEYLKPRLKEYDFCTIRGYFYPGDVPRSYKTIKPRIDRIAVHGFNIHNVFGSPSFYNELGFQIQKQIEEEIGINEINNIPNFQMGIVTFCPLIKCDGMAYLHEVQNGICYSYALCRIEYESKLFKTFQDDYVRVWVRFYSLKTPNVLIDTKDDFSSESIKFEICNMTPKSYPKIEDCHQSVIDDYEIWQKSPGTKRLLLEYEKFLYTNPGQWKEVLKEKINFVLEKNRKAEERAKRKAEKEKKKIPVEYPAEILYWPDIIYHLTMNGDVTEDTVDEITDVISEYFESLKGEKPEFFSVDKVNGNICDITVDFGMSPVKTLKGVVKAIEKAGINIEKIVIEG